MVTIPPPSFCSTRPPEALSSVPETVAAMRPAPCVVITDLGPVDEPLDELLVADEVEAVVLLEDLGLGVVERDERDGGRVEQGRDAPEARARPRPGRTRTGAPP
jgi:hypothetical protein